MSSRPLRTLAGLACVALLTSACSSESSEPPAAEAPTRAPSAASPTADRSTPVAAAALRFTAPRLGGGTVEGEDLAGRDVAFWFWAPW